jgi:hypothetical protein
MYIHHKACINIIKHVHLFVRILRSITNYQLQNKHTFTKQLLLY